MSKVVYDAVTPSGKRVARFEFFGPTKQKAENSARSFARRKNVFAGFHDDTGFHPIRASADYSPSRAGESRKRKPAAKKRAKKKNYTVWAAGHTRKVSKKKAKHSKRFRNGRPMSRLQAKYFG